MKKLLALLLCVMLLVSVVPTSAFAAEISGSAIGLGPAYEARNTLFAAFGLLGAAVAAKNTVVGTADSLDLFIPKIIQYLPAVLAALNYDDEQISQVVSIFPMLKTELSGLIGEEMAEFLEEDFPAEFPNGVSMETLFKVLGPLAVEYHNLLGNTVAVGSTELAIDNQTVGVYNDLNGIFTEFGLEPVAQVPINVPVIIANLD